MKYFNFLIATVIISTSVAQKNTLFSGELVYNIERINPKDSIPSKMLVYAKDSLLKIINFSSTLGKQEMIKHLRLNRSYVLVSTTKGDFAIKSDHNKTNDTTQSYTFTKKFGRKKIAGLKAKRIIVSFKGVEKKFTFYYTPKINSIYNGSFQNLPGLLLEYYLVNENGKFKYTLEDIKISDPPLEIFSVPSKYKKVSLEEFIMQVSAQ